MLYKRNREKNLDKELFRNPGSEYRGMPFWAWNTKLCKDELNEQIDIFRSMGFGGFYMHVRQGLEDDYMGKDFMDAVKSCTQKAKDENMYACLYDEDRWPSGVAGGEVTKEKKYRLRYLTMTASDRYDDAPDREQALEEGRSYFLGAFEIETDRDGYMTSYRKAERAGGSENKRYFFVDVKPGGEPRYNYQCYSDTMNREAVDKFISLTYDKFKDGVGAEFGGVIPTIFTDEPQLQRIIAAEPGLSEADAVVPWTMDFDTTYLAAFGSDIKDSLPELYFGIKGDGGYRVRYNYHRHISERFNEAYMDNIGDWCGRNGIMMTGHVLGEDSLYEMCLTNNDVMRTYRKMQFPGIDILFNDRCYTTAVQCRSVVRQYGREGMMSEMYGVTGWDYDFRGHKFQGDWQACLGVTHRVPHLAWQTMKGEGKRDYPASIFYQSPWHKEYKYIEDHFARIATVMTRGEAVVRTAVIHPVETYWLYDGTGRESFNVYENTPVKTGYKRREMEEHFAQIAEWLLTGSVDFDYIAESLLEDLCGEGSYPLNVGKCTYDTIIVSDCETLRPHTIKVLEQFKKSGGKLIFMGNTPRLSLGEDSSEAKALVEGAVCISHSKAALYELMSDSRDAVIKYDNGALTDNLLFTVRQDGDDRWLFVAHKEMPELAHISEAQKIIIAINGEYVPVLYDTLTGDIKSMPYSISDGKTNFECTIYGSDTLLVKLEKSGISTDIPKTVKTEYGPEIKLSPKCSYTLPEPNVLVLDMAQYAVNDGEMREEEEILRIDEIVRKELGLDSRRSKVVQPYYVKDVPESHRLDLRFVIHSDTECDGCRLAMENSGKAHITLNGVQVSNTSDGWYVDKYIDTIPLPKLIKGDNILDISMPFGLRTALENCFILGDFGTAYKGRFAYITEKQAELYFGNVVHQGLAFYGGNVEYDTSFVLDETSDVEFEVSYYRGALVKVIVDGEDRGNIAFAPFRLRVDGLGAGEHKVKFVLYGNRYNTFSALHTLLADKKRVYVGPDYWRSSGDAWAYEYQTRPMGILKTPLVRKVK